MKKILLMMLMCMVGISGIQAARVYTSYDSSTKTLTYYYDDNFNASDRPNSVAYDPSALVRRWESYHDVVTKVVIDASMKNAPLTSMDAMFFGTGSLTLSKVTTISGMSNLNTSKVTQMDYMFYGLKSLTSLDLSEFNTAKVTDMQCMFYDCRTLTSLDLTSFNTANVTNMRSMFNGCDALLNLNLSSFNTTKVTDMGYMFANCSALVTLDIAKFRITSLTKAEYMFSNCLELVTIYCNSNWSNNSTLTSSEKMFAYSTKLVGGNGTTFSESRVDREYARPDASGLRGYFTKKQVVFAEISVNGEIMYIYYGDNTDAAELDWNADGVGAANMSSTKTNKIKEVMFMQSMQNALPTTCRQWFYQFKNMTKITDIDYLNTTEVTSFRATFSGCANLASIGLAGFNTEKVTNMSAMFYGCAQLTSLDLDKFNTQKVTTMHSMFKNCSNLKTIYCDANWNANAKLTQATNMFYGCEKLKGGKGTKFDENSIDKTYARPDRYKREGYFTGKEVFAYQNANYPTYIFLDYMYKKNNIYNNWIEGWTEDAGTQKMDSLLKTQITRVTFKSTMKDARPTTTQQWFRGLINLTEFIDLSYLNTSETTYMYGMFSDCQSLNWLDLSSFDTQNATYMGAMFYNCKNLTTLNISSFNTSNVENMYCMFYCCKSLTSLDVSHFDTQNVTDMNRAFAYCHGLTSLDLRNWDVSKVKDMQGLFASTNNGTLTTIYCDADWSQTAVSLEDSHDMFINCTPLVGGMGTVFDANHTDIAYARPDGGESAPGYFTSTAQGIDEIQSDNLQATKVIRDGKLFIEINGRTYDVTGAEVR